MHQYSSLVHGGNSSQAGSKIPTMSEMYLQSIKSVKHNAAKSVNRASLKKSRHIGFGVFIVHSSMARGKGGVGRGKWEGEALWEFFPSIQANWGQETNSQRWRRVIQYRGG